MREREREREKARVSDRKRAFPLPRVVDDKKCAKAKGRDKRQGRGGGEGGGDSSLR